MQNDIKTRLTALPVILLGFFLLLSLDARAEVTPPDQVLESATKKMIRELNSRADEIQRDPSIINDLIEEIILPHIDFISVSKWALGKHWRTASKEQKLEFIHQFRTLLLRFYSTALANYITGKTIPEDMFVFLPLRAAEDSKRVTVRSEVHSKNGKITQLNYNMHLTRKGWKIYDVTVDGVSMISTYRNGFATEIRQKGLDGLIANMKLKNEQLKKTALIAAKNPAQLAAEQP